MKNVVILIGVIGLALCGCQPETQPNPNLAIESTLKSYETALNASDTDAVLALYAEDGVFMPREGPTAAGKEQIRAAYEHVFDTINTDTEQEYTRYLRPGDQITADTTLESISEEKATALGIGYFIVTRTIFRDQNGEEVGWMTFRVLKFKPQNQPQAQTDTAAAPSKPTRIKSPRGHDNRWWWEAVDQGMLLIQKCKDCGALRHPPRPMCGQCQSLSWEGVPSSGQGSVYSFTVLHHPPIPGYDFPCPVGLIDLEEGTRIVANIAGCALEDIHIGMKVECRIEDADETMKLPFFYPVR